MPPPDVQKCRTCLRENDSQLYLPLDHYIEEENSKILDMLDTILPQLKIKNEILQQCQQICQDCYDMLLYCHRFHQLCIESHRKLLASLKPEDRVLIESIIDGKNVIIKQDLDDEEEEEEKQEEDVYNNQDSVMPMEELNIKFDINWLDSNEGNFTTTQKQDELLPMASIQRTSSKRVHICPICLRTFSSAPSLKRHNKLHDPTAPFSCRLCTYRFDSERAQRRHMLLFHTANKGHFQCPDCLQIFWEKSSLVLHSKKHSAIPQASATSTTNMATVTEGELIIKNEIENEEFESEEGPQGTKEIKTNEEIKSVDPQGTTYNRNKLLIKRGRRNNASGTFPCPSCKKRFFSKFNLKRHFLLFHDPNHAFACNICKYRFETVERYRHHIFTQHNTQDTKVEEVEKPKAMEMINNKGESDSQDEDDDDDDGKDATNDEDFVITGPGKIEKPRPSYIRRQYPCEICGRNLGSLFRLERHKPLHSPDRPFECTQCKNRYLFAHQLKSHMLKHDSQKANNGFQCPNCTRRFETRSSLGVHHWQVHVRKVPESSSKKYVAYYPCETCNRHFLTSAALSRHITKDHPDRERYKCDQCEKTFILKAQLQEHLNRHRGIKNFVCLICQQMTSNKTELREHMMSVHSVAEQFTCSKCGKNLSSLSSLQQHMERHKGEKKYACKQCPGRFKCRVDLHKHVQTHTNSKDHVCDICGLRYTRASTLKAHKAKHEGIKPHACDQCDRCFVNADQLRRHYRTHTGEKPYKCQYCDRAYAQSGDLNKHLRTHIGEKTYRCSECPMAYKYHAELQQHLWDEHYKKLRQQEVEEGGGEIQLEPRVDIEINVDTCEENLQQQMSNIIKLL
ncbi:zinc finger protein 420-like [Musca vetustissima]|uniref:zinc finger protein 420-like n=1 Tax=Musca vetustissima TaxID=27455 RepID=UPI002AB68F6D|nr:zinc finger protein 420-like [Musca vetustissima]